MVVVLAIWLWGTLRLWLDEFVGLRLCCMGWEWVWLKKINDMVWVMVWCRFDVMGLRLCCIGWVWVIWFRFGFETLK